jgi:FAD-dependent urate hydroxylase
VNQVDVAIVGAGPYGLSVAAHLQDHGVDHRIFGSPMNTWTRHMPDGMVLRSEGFASNLSDRHGELTLARYCSDHAIDHEYPTPVPIELFRAYSEWFIERSKVSVEDLQVQNIVRDNGGFALELPTGETVKASKLVMAIGVTHFVHVAPELAGLPHEVCTHPSEHDRLDGFAGKDVTIIGIGQSALETAALLHENGARVRVVGRKTSIQWNGIPPALDRPVVERAQMPLGGLSAGWKPWLFEHAPFAFRGLPLDQRVRLGTTTFGPAGAWWLRERVEGRMPVLLGRRITAVSATPNGALLEFDGPEGHEVFETDHVIAATGYKADLDSLTFVDAGLRSELRRSGRSPLLGRHFESSVPGLHFVGMTAATSFGPVVRFVLGTKYAAHSVAKKLSAGSRG